MRETPYLYEVTNINEEHPAVLSKQNPDLRIGGILTSVPYLGEEHAMQTEKNGIISYLCTVKLVGRKNTGGAVDETKLVLPDLKRMRLYAQLATQGPWEATEGDDYDPPSVISHHGIPPEHRYFSYYTIPNDHDGNDARYIAMAHPQAMLAILNHIDQLETKVAELSRDAQ